MILFVSQLRTVLRSAGGGQTFWPNVVFAAGILLVTGIVIAGVFEVVLISAAHNHEIAIVKEMNFVGDNNELGFIFGMALLTLATGCFDSLESLDQFASEDVGLVVAARGHRQLPRTYRLLLFPVRHADLVHSDRFRNRHKGTPGH